MMADNDLEEMRSGYMDPSGRDLTVAGRILGIVATAMMAISIVIVIFFLALSR